MKLPEAVSILRECRGARISAIGSERGLDWVVLRESTVGQPAGVSTPAPAPSQSPTHRPPASALRDSVPTDTPNP